MTEVSSTPEVSVVQFTRNCDTRGSLTVSEHPASLPFRPVRFFIVGDIVAGDVRGDHAHRECHQLLVCTSGAVDVEVVSPNGQVSVYSLDRSDIGLHIPPLIWARQRYLTKDSQLLVLASHPYEAAEYISDLDEYATLRGAEA